MIMAQVPGVVAFIGADDIPKGGSNAVNCGMTDVLVFAKDRVDYVSQPLGVIVATSPSIAANAAKLVEVQYGHPKVCPSLYALALACLTHCVRAR